MMLKSTEIAPDDLGEEVELNEEDDDYSDEDTETEERRIINQKKQGTKSFVSFNIPWNISPEGVEY